MTLQAGCKSSDCELNRALDIQAQVPPDLLPEAGSEVGRLGLRQGDTPWKSQVTGGRAGIPQEGAQLQKLYWVCE